MEINEIVEKIEAFAPLELQEDWDSSGWQIDLGIKDIKKIILCLSLTKNIIEQAVNKKADMIISHHPFIFPHAVPLEFNKNIPIYSAHTNLDKTDGGTTDTLIKLLGYNEAQKISNFLRLVNLKKEIPLEEFIKHTKEKLNLKIIKIVNNQNRQTLNKIAFCAGSGADFINEADAVGADAIVTGDVKYHTALESNVIIIDIGHFESEYPVLKTLKKILQDLGVEAVIADEKSPFINC